MRYWAMLLLWYNCLCHAQSVHLTNLTLEQGLPSNNVYDVISGPDDRIWFATDQGVAHFDGRNVTSFGWNDGLSDIDIFGFHLDQQNRLWLRTANGHPTYLEHGNFHSHLTDPWMNKLHMTSYILGIEEDTQGNLVFTSVYHGMKKLSRDGGVVSGHPDELLLNSVHFLEGDAYTISTTGILKVDPITLKTVGRVLSFPPSVFVRSFVRDGDIILSLNASIMRLDTKEEALDTLHTFPNNIVALDTIGDLIWVGTRSGAYRCTMTDGQALMVSDSLLQGLTVTGVCQDFEGGLWFSTLEEGVFHAEANGNYLLYSEKQPGSHISAMAFDSLGTLWLGFNNNRFGWLDSTGVLHAHILSADYPNRVNAIRFIGSDMWVISGSGTQRWSGNQIVFHPFPANDVLRLPGRYVLGSHTLYEVDSSVFESFQSTNDILKPPKLEVAIETDLEEKVLKLHSSHDGKVWVGTISGLYLWGSDGLSPVHYKERPLGQVNGICPYEDGLIVTTLNNGAFFIPEEGPPVVLRLNGKSLDETCLQCSTDGGLGFILTNKRVLQLVEGLELKVFDGVSGGGINRIVVKEGSLLYTKSGSVYISSVSQELQREPPRLALDLVSSTGHALPPLGGISIPYGDNIVFSFSGISFRQPKELVYEYRLVGEHESWQPTASNQIEFSSLSPGNYTFLIRASTRPGEYGQTLTYRFFVERPYYQKWWFILSLVLGALLLVFLLWSWRMRALKRRFFARQALIEAERRRVETEKELLEMEQMALRLQMNPHFIFNALNTIKGYYTSNDISKANTYISKFSKLLRIVLESKDSMITLDNEINLLALYADLMQLRFENEFVFNVSCDPSVDKEGVLIPAMLLQPFVENALIHGVGKQRSGGEVHVSFRREGPHLLCSIQDNGPGIRPNTEWFSEQEQKLNSTDLIKRRITLMNRSTAQNDYMIDIQNLSETPGQLGTRVTISLPYTQL